MASPTKWTSVWVDSRNWWWTRGPCVLRFMGSQKVGYDWAAELNWVPVLSWDLAPLHLASQVKNLGILLQSRRCRLDPWVGKIFWRREQQPTPVFLPGEFWGQRSLTGYNPWDLKELGTTKWQTLTYWCLSDSLVLPSLLLLFCKGQCQTFCGDPKKIPGGLKAIALRVSQHARCQVWRSTLQMPFTGLAMYLGMRTAEVTPLAS